MCDMLSREEIDALLGCLNTNIEPKEVEPEYSWEDVKKSIKEKYNPTYNFSQYEVHQFKHKFKEDVESVEKDFDNKILVVDDAAFLRMMVKDILTKNGYNNIEQANDSLMALEKYLSFKPELVILDINMNTPTAGIDILKEIRLRSKETKIIMLSAHSTFDMIEQSLESGCDDFIVKPFQPDELIKAINNLLK